MEKLTTPEATTVIRTVSTWGLSAPMIARALGVPMGFVRITTESCPDAKSYRTLHHQKCITFALVKEAGSAVVPPTYFIALSPGSI